MEIVVIFNGLGNQMSQYAFYLAKKKKVKKCCFIFDPLSKSSHNGSELDKLFGIKYQNGFLFFLIKFIFRLARKRIIGNFLSLFGIHIIREHKNYDFDSSYLEQHNGWLNFYVGGWHCEKYFHEIRQEILRCFMFPEIKESPECLNIQYKIENTNSVFVHIRRGDYLNQAANSFYHYEGVATKDYYLKAINEIKNEVTSPVFFFFSNDIKWCRENFIGDNYFFVDCNVGKYSWRDMFLMSKCKYHITANSTFSWWAAWLCDSEIQKTICPSRFFTYVETKDIYPENWHKL